MNIISDVAAMLQIQHSVSAGFSKMEYIYKLYVASSVEQLEEYVGRFKSCGEGALFRLKSSSNLKSDSKPCLINKIINPPFPV